MTFGVMEPTTDFGIVYIWGPPDPRVCGGSINALAQEPSDNH
jgi:hypothetical protein